LSASRAESLNVFRKLAVGNAAVYFHGSMFIRSDSSPSWANLDPAQTCAAQPVWVIDPDQEPDPNWSHLARSPRPSHAPSRRRASPAPVDAWERLLAGAEPCAASPSREARARRGLRSAFSDPRRAERPN
jgi:hypothetical protein